ncbi:MAG: hypothetical protein H6622_16675 [Halobacteriovoraceae bacterium]|nr:hypothetical protein [Halobacteriovoraceae bacterium]
MIDDKVKKAIINYMREKRFMIVDPSNVSKSSITSVLKMTAAPKAHMFFARNFSEAEDILKRVRPEVIFSTVLIEDQTYSKLLDLHLKMLPNRLKSSFFVIGEKLTLDISMRIQKGEIDDLIQKPFTVNSLQSTILKSITPKLAPTPYKEEIEQAKENIDTDPDRALQHIETAKRFSDRPADAWMLEGKIWARSKQLARAKECFFKGLEYDPGSFQCLTELFKILSLEKENRQAYKIGNIMLRNYPVDPTLIPEFTRMSVANAEYEDIFIYHEAFKQVLRPDTIMKNHIAASLTVYGKRIIKDKYELNKNVDPELFEKAMNTMEMATEICKGKPLIYTSIMEGLKMAKEVERLHQVIEKAKEEFPDSLEIRIMEVVANDVSLSPADSLKKTIEIIRSGFKAPEFYKIIIERSIELDLSKRLINTHLNEAITEFPEHRETFEKLVA